MLFAYTHEIIIREIQKFASVQQFSLQSYVTLEASQVSGREPIPPMVISI